MVTKTRARVAGLLSKSSQYGSIAIFAVALSACSSMPDWTSPINWSGAEDGAASTQTEVPPEVRAAEAEVNAEVAEFPEIADIPEMPDDLDTPAERQKKAQGLMAARAPGYTDEDLIGGTPAITTSTEPHALEPEMSDTADFADDVDEVVDMADTDMMPGEVTQAPVAPTTEDLPPVTGVVADSTDDSPGPPGGTVTPPDPLPQVTLNENPITAPHMPDDLAGTEDDASPMLAYDDGPPRALSFAPSSAPPLDPEALAYVPPIVARRYDETRMAASRPHDIYESRQLPGVATRLVMPSQDSVAVDYGAIGEGDIGGPMVAPPRLEQLAGAVSAGSAGPVMRGGNSAVIYFGHNSSRLNDADRAIVAEILRYHGQHGGQVRLIGHSSSRTRDMPVDDHLMANYKMSVKRAESVAKEFARQGANPAALVVEAKGDSEPIFYESMPSGEAGNRRVEIYVQ